MPRAEYYIQAEHFVVLCSSDAHSQSNLYWNSVVHGCKHCFCYSNVQPLKQKKTLCFKSQRASGWHIERHVNYRYRCIRRLRIFTYPYLFFVISTLFHQQKRGKQRPQTQKNLVESLRLILFILLTICEIHCLKITWTNLFKSLLSVRGKYKSN